MAQIFTCWRIVWRISAVILVGLISGVVGLLVGAILGGNFFPGFLFNGVQGYEATRSEELSSSFYLLFVWFFIGLYHWHFAGLALDVQTQARTINHRRSG